ncbi:MAG: hypothetical protein ABI165_10970 [Bryobacteraceae bacterium]
MSKLRETISFYSLVAGGLGGLATLLVYIGVQFPTGKLTQILLFLSVVLYLMTFAGLIYFYFRSRPRRTPTVETTGPDVLKDCPKLIVRCPKSGFDRTLSLTNDGESAAVNVEIGPLIHEEHHEIFLLNSKFGSIPSKATEQRSISVAQRQPNSGAALWDTIRAGAMVPDPLDSVTVEFGDSSGRHFSQSFRLTTEVDGSVTWLPERVTLRPPFHAATVGL